MTLSIQLLGTLHITRDGEPVSLPTRKAAAILAYLAMHPSEAISRESLAVLLWPDSENARTNLRPELVRLRQALGDENGTALLAVSRYSVSLRTSHAWIDGCRILELLEQCAAHPHPDSKSCPGCYERLAQAVELYTGPLLADFGGVNSSEFDEWLEMTREAFESRIVAALETLQNYAVELGAHGQVVKYARQHLALRPWLEQPTLRLMTALTLSNAREEALDLYESLRHHLSAEFGEKPDPALTKMYESIRAQRRIAEQSEPMSCPYPGLAAFGIDDADNFYGRESIVQILTDAVERQPLVLLTGPSGSGKSSVIQAGLRPRLLATQTHQGAAVVPWRIFTFRPGRNPLFHLAQALFPEGDSEGAARDMAAALQHKNTSLRQIVRQAARSNPVQTAEQPKGERIVLIADQFEEIFTLCEDESVRRLFLAALFAGAEGEEANRAQVTILISLRADFMGQALSYRSFSNIAHENVIFLGMMNDEDLRRAIEEPARQNGVEYEPGLIERILDDLDDSPGQLPLLQFALAMLWEKRTGNWITHAAYNDIEEVSGALTHYANGIYARMTPGERERMRRILLQLVHPGEGVEDTRRIASRLEIGDENWPLVHKLAGARLVVTSQDRRGQESVEVIHEALIHEWKRLREWMETDREFRLWQNRARTALRIWQREGEHTDALLRGLALGEAAHWLDERLDDLDNQMRLFIRVSLAAQQAVDERERQHRLDLERALAESKRQEQRALARQLGAQADQLMRRKVDLALLLSGEALERSLLPQDRTDLLTTLDINPYLEKILHNDGSAVFYLSFSADGKSLISSDDRNNLMRWNLADFTATRLVPPETDAIDDVALDVTGHWAATVHAGRVILWEIATGRVRDLDPNFSSPIFRLRFAVDGNYLLAIAISGDLCLWECATGQQLPSPAKLDKGTSLQVGPGAEFLATAEDDGFAPVIGLRRRTTGELLTPFLRGHREMVHGLALSRDGSRLASASFDGTVRLWETQTGLEALPPLTGHTGRALYALFSPDGQILATGGTDNLLLLWDARTGRRLDYRPFTHNNWVRCAAFSPDGRLLAVGDSDGKIYLWDLTCHALLAGHTKRARTVAANPNGASFATISFDGTVGIWDIATRQRRGSLSLSEERQGMAGVFSPDGRRFAAVDHRGELSVWETANWQLQYRLPNLHNEPSIALAFSPDSRLLAHGDLDGYVSLWDMGRGEAIHAPIRLHTGLASWILCLAFTPDGKTLTTGGKNGTIGFWSVPELKATRRPIQAHTNWVTDLLYTSSGELLISTSSDGTVRFWNPLTGAESRPPLTGHEGQVWGAAFSPTAGEEVLITLGGNGSVLWWDLASHTPIAPPLLTHTETESIAFSPDGLWLYLGSFDGTAHAWKVPQGGWSERVRRIANRSLTPEERSIYLGDTSNRGGGGAGEQ